ncbi:MarR family transcriptional regulator [Xanthobacter autotrophicus]|uniref:MarR family transcriptional regulator n=1 Tax=Xanthobacter autotrophicus TaxID=280 RepID=UPI00372D6C52
MTWVPFNLAAYHAHRTNADKRADVLAWLREYPELSDREIARRAGVSPQTVGNIKKDCGMREMLLEPLQSKSGAWRRAHVFRCYSCGKRHEIASGKNGTEMPVQFLTKKMSQIGWHLGKRPEEDICGDCAAKPRSAPDMTKSIAKSFPVVKVEDPRMPSFDERRLIFAKLNDVYLDEKTGYSGVWSDKKVAEDLGVPWKWVQDIRAENFGPAGDNEAAREVVAEAKLLLNDIEFQRKERERQDKQFVEREEALRKKLGEVFKALA